MASLKLKRAINTLLKDYLSLNDEESILIISDTKKQELSLLVFELAKKITGDVYYLELGKTGDGQDLPNIIFEASKAVDTILVVATLPIYQSRMLSEISNLGIRVAILPQISEDGLSRSMQAETQEISKNAHLFESKLKNTSIVRLESKNGTDISLPIKNRDVFVHTGILTKIGETGIVPSSKVFVSPWDEKSNGVIVFDGYIDQIGILKSTVTVQIEDGVATKITGDGDEAKHLAKILNKHGEEARNLAEFGLGINPKAIISSDFYESESSLGTCFISFGSNLKLGGNVDIPLRLSCVIEKPNVLLDDENFIANGKLIL